jgi:beta-lactamase class A
MRRVARRVLWYRFPGILPVILIVTLIAGVTLTGNIGATPVVVTPTASPMATPAPATPSAAASPINVQATSAQDLASHIPSILAADTGVYGVVVIDPSGAIAYEHNADVPFISASLYKLPLMAQIYAMIGSGLVTLDQEIVLDPSFYPDWDVSGDSYYSTDFMWMTTTVQEALFAAGAYSSNVGALALASLTTWPDIDAMAKSLGMTSTDLVVYPAGLAAWPPALGTSDDAASMAQAVAFVETQTADGPVMITTPRDVATFFQRLLANNVVSPETSAAITDVLSQQVVDDRFPQLLPEGTQLIHKTGNLDHVVHDAGAIYTTSGPVILAALSEDSVDDDIATAIIQQLALTAYTAYDSTSH